MGLFDLVAKLSLKPTSTYSDFLSAHSKLVQMKDTQANLGILTNCITKEHAEGSDKCIAYVRTHGIDKAILQLHPSIDVEDFLIAMFNLADYTYLTSEFAHSIWQYGSFPRLICCVAELYIVHGVFSITLASRIVEDFHKLHPDVISGLVLLSPEPTYGEAFRELGLIRTVVDTANALCARMDSRAVSVIDFLCYYSDLSGIFQMDQLMLKGAECPGFDYPHPSESILFPTRLKFFAELFSKIKNNSLRIAVVKASISYVSDPLFPEFFHCAMLAAPALMAGLLSEPRERAEWDPHRVLDIMEGVVPSRYKGEYVPRVGSECRVYSFPLLDLLLESCISDIKIYYFLFLNARKTFLSRIDDILKVCKEDDGILGIVKGEMLLGNYNN